MPSEGDDHGHDGRQDDVLAPLVDHLAGQDAADRQEEPGHRGRLEAGRRADHDVPERPGDEEQIEVDERQQDDPGAGRDQLVAQPAEGGAVVPHGHHRAGVVLDPADEEGARQDPDQGGEPPPLDRDDRADDRRGAGDRLELVAEEDVLVGGHEFHPVHVHLRRGGPFGIGFDDLRVDVLGVDAIPEKSDDKT